MNRCISIGISLSLVLGSILSCFNISFANNDNSSYVFSKNTHGVNNINLQDETLEEEEFEDSESGRIPFEP